MKRFIVSFNFKGGSYIFGHFIVIAENEEIAQEDLTKFWEERCMWMGPHEKIEFKLIKEDTILTPNSNRRVELRLGPLENLRELL